MDYLSWVENNWGLLGRVMQGHTAVYRRLDPASAATTLLERGV
jgi:hypothetical protein